MKHIVGKYLIYKCICKINIINTVAIIPAGSS